MTTKSSPSSNNAWRKIFLEPELLKFIQWTIEHSDLHINPKLWVEDYLKETEENEDE